MARRTLMSSSSTPQKPKVSLAPVKSLSSPSADAAEDVAARTKSSAQAEPVPPALKVMPAAATSPQPATATAPTTAPASAPAFPAAQNTATDTAKNTVKKAGTVQKEAPVPQAPAAKAKPAAQAPLQLPSGSEAPAFSALGETLLQNQMAVARQLGALHTLALDHAVLGLTAGLEEAEELSRTTTLSDAVLVQARAFRRSQEAVMAYFADVAKAARG
jgi:hypothetical protein